MSKVFQLTTGNSLTNHFDIHTPDLQTIPWNELTGKPYQLVSRATGYTNNPILLQGELLYLGNSGDLFFLGAPRVNVHNTPDDVKERMPVPDIKPDNIFFRSSGMTPGGLISQDPDRVKNPFESTETIKGMAITDAKGAIEWVDREFERTTGYALKEIVGLRPRDVIYGTGSTYIPKSYVDEMTKFKRPFSFDNIGYNRWKASFWFRTTVQPILDANNEVKGRYYTFEDVTTLKKNENALRESQELWKYALEGAGDGVWFYDLSKSDLQVSSKYKELLGWKQKDTYAIADFIESMQTGDLEHIRSVIIRGFTKSKPDFSYELQLKTKNGVSKYYKTRGKVIDWSDDGRPRTVFGTLTDINEEKLKDIAIREQREYFHRILNELPADVIILSPDQKFRFLNRSAVRDDRMRDWLIGKDMYDYCRERNLPADLADSRKRLFDTAVASQQVSKEIDRRVRPDGSEEYKLRFLYPFLDNDGQIDFLVGFGIDITEQVNNEKKIIEQREYYQNILDAIPADIAILSPDHKYEFVNTSAVRDPEMREWIIGKDDFDYCSRKNLDKKIAAHRRAMFNKMLTTNKASSFIDEIKRDDGTSLFKLRFFHPYADENGILKFIVGYGVDITEEIKNKQLAELQERQIRNLLNIIRDGVFSFDTQGRIHFSNNSFRHILNIESQDHGRLLSFFDLLPAGEISKVKQKLDLLRSSGNPQSGVIHFLNPAGKKIFLDFSFTKTLQNT